MGVQDGSSPLRGAPFKAIQYNNYPREILGFATASDLFAAHLAAA